jgi:hypothetical protein
MPSVRIDSSTLTIQMPKYSDALPVNERPAGSAPPSPRPARPQRPRLPAAPPCRRAHPPDRSPAAAACHNPRVRSCESIYLIRIREPQRRRCEPDHFPRAGGGADRLHPRRLLLWLPTPTAMRRRTRGLAPRFGQHPTVTEARLRQSTSLRCGARASSEAARYATAARLASLRRSVASSCRLRSRTDCGVTSTSSSSSM